jgi:hypothetical protein
MKYKNIQYAKQDINITLKFAEDFKVSIRNEKKATEIIKYSKDSIIGRGVGTLEIIQTKKDSEIKHYFFFKSFTMNTVINQQHVFYDQNILNDEKIGLNEDRLKFLNISYELEGEITDITDKAKKIIKVDNAAINKIKQNIETKLKNNNKKINIKIEAEPKKEVDNTKKEKQPNTTEVK